METNKKIEIETTKLVVDTYNKIALWTQGEYDSSRQKSDALKIICQDIIQNTLEELVRGIDVKTNTEVTRGDVKVGDTQSIKEESSFDKVNEKEIFDKLFINNKPQQ